MRSAIPSLLATLCCTSVLSACEGIVLDAQGRDAQAGGGDAALRDSGAGPGDDAGASLADSGTAADSGTSAALDASVSRDTGGPGPQDASAGPGLDACTPLCTGKACGADDGCGGRCRGCSGAGEVCDTQTWTCAKPCVADCTGKTCGDGDGCGGRCTTCPTASQSCNTGSWTCTACGLTCGGHGQCFVSDGLESCNCDDGYYHRLSTAGCEAAAGTACEGVACSSHGTCLTSLYGGVSCHCDPGYYAYGATCTPETRWGCRDRDGSFKARGTSRCSDDNTVIETCRDADGDGNVEWAFGATPSCAAGPTCSACIGAGCNVAAGGQPCPKEQYCMQSTHELEVWACVQSCDCTNCGDCGLGDGCYQGMQAFCGGCSTGPATVTCKWPCTNGGDGCIPYSDPASGAVGLCYPMEGCFSAPPAF